MDVNSTPTKQVDKSHYEFRRYVDKARWTSVWHQVDEAVQLAPARTLEIGPGPGLFKSVSGLFGLKVETLDPDPELQPDHVGTATALPFSDGEYDLVCAFQVLEHLPYEQSLLAFEEMARVARKNVLISLPDDRTVWPYTFYIPKLGASRWQMPRPFWKPRPAVFNGEHYWEIGKQGFPLTRVIADFGRVRHLLRTYRVHENPYHRFFVFGARPGRI